MPYYEVILVVEDQTRARFQVPVGESRGGANLWGDEIAVIYHPEEMPDEERRRDYGPAGINEID